MARVSFTPAASAAPAAPVTEGQVAEAPVVPPHPRGERHTLKLYRFDYSTAEEPLDYRYGVMAAYSFDQARRLVQQHAVANAELLGVESPQELEVRLFELPVPSGAGVVTMDGARRRWTGTVSERSVLWRRHAPAIWAERDDA